MKYNIRLYILFALFWLISSFGFAQKSTKFAVINDIHFFSEKLAPTDRAKLNYNQHTGRDLNILHEVLDTVIARIATEKPDILLIVGDITNHGERQSHIDFIEKMQPLLNKNIRILVIPGNHDIQVPNSKKYTENEVLATESVSPEELAHLYADFGYASAIKRDTASLSYLVKIDNHTQIICFDTNRYTENTTNSISSGRILPETLRWALEILDDAKKQGITVLGMMHHGLIEHITGQSMFFSAYLIHDWQTNSQILADAGLKAVFTGHFHANDATAYTSPSGNTITDIETGGLAHFPFSYRIGYLYENELVISTYSVDSIATEPNLKQIYRDKLYKNASRLVENRLQNFIADSSPETKKSIVNLIAQMVVLHTEGDENPDEMMLNEIENLSRMLENENTINSFTLDFPTQDNNLIIRWK